METKPSFVRIVEYNRSMKMCDKQMYRGTPRPPKTAEEIYREKQQRDEENWDNHFERVEKKTKVSILEDSVR
jgi:hypothetical protein